MPSLYKHVAVEVAFDGSRCSKHCPFFCDAIAYDMDDMKQAICMLDPQLPAILGKKDKQFHRQDECIDREISMSLEYWNSLNQECKTHCFDCKHLQFPAEVMSTCDLYCGKYNESLHYFDGPNILRKCHDENGKELREPKDRGRTDCTVCKYSEPIIFTSGKYKEKNSVWYRCTYYEIALHNGLVHVRCSHFKKRRKQRNGY